MNWLYKIWPIAKKLLYYGACLYGAIWASVFSVSLMAYGGAASIVFGAFLLVVVWIAFMFLLLREVMYYAGKID